MSLKSWYNNWKYKQYRVHGTGKDFDWLHDAQKIYPEAFLKTKEYLENFEEKSFKQKLDSSKNFSLSGGGIPWIILISMSAWLLPQYTNIWPAELQIKVDKSFNITSIALPAFVIIELFRFYVVASPYINIKPIDELRNFWRSLSHGQYSQEDALNQTNLFIARQNAERARANAMDVNSSSLVNKAAILIQWVMVFAVVISGTMMFDCQYYIKHHDIRMNKELIFPENCKQK